MTSVEALPPRSSTPQSEDGTVLPFPDRFHAASEFVFNPPPGAVEIDDETKLILYALSQQAVHGECNEPKPWAWSVVDAAKWNSWKQLKDMPKVEAMRLYVKVLEDSVQPDWWLLSRGAALQKGGSRSSGAADPKGVPKSLKNLSIAGSWAAADTSAARRPAPRYEHAVTLFRRRLYVIGGNYSGRYLSDVWTLDLDTLTWSQLQTTAAPQEAIGGGLQEATSKEEEALLAPPMVPIAGHALVMWGESILCIGGHTKNKKPAQRMVVRALDTGSNVWSTLQPSGEVPENRGSHTATMLGNKVYVFGGEDRSRRAVAHLFVLDMTTLQWQQPVVEGLAPSARAAHTACAVDDRFLVIFGGGSVARCYNDVWVLDTHSNTWSCPKPSGTVPSARAGHAGDILDGKWYVVGGGNNTSACSDLVTLDLTGLTAPAGETSEAESSNLHWEVAAQTDLSAPTASEGLSLSSIPELGLLLAFGGYNGKYNSGLQVYRPGPASQSDGKPSVEKESTQSAASSSQSQSKPPSQAGRPPLGERRAVQLEEGKSTTPRAAASEAASIPNGHASSLSRATSMEDKRAASLEARVRDVTASKEAVQTELQLMRKQLTGALDAKTALDKDLQDVRHQLKAEQNKVFRLEVQLAEANEKLELMPDLEKQLNNYRKMIEEAQSGKGKGSLWGYISGAPQ